MRDRTKPLNLDEGRNADWIKIVGRARKFGLWTSERIDLECRDAYFSFHDEVRTRHIAYYSKHSTRRSETRAFAASSRPFAFAPGWEHLSETLAEGSWHRYHLSGGSSQVLAIALLSAAIKADPTLSWLPGEPTLGASPTTLFEAELAPHVLNEQPRQTSLDWLVFGASGVVAAEAKFTEQGFGGCSCVGKPHCSSRVLERPYWEIASRELGLTRNSGAGCALSLAYQPVRNIAAAAAIAGPNRQASFLLLYDDRNPYFSGAGSWAGWVAVLGGLTQFPNVRFDALSWQRLLTQARMDADIVRWAYEKHGIEARG